MYNNMVWSCEHSWRRDRVIVGMLPNDSPEFVGTPTNGDFVLTRETALLVIPGLVEHPSGRSSMGSGRNPRTHSYDDSS